MSTAIRIVFAAGGGAVSRVRVQREEAVRPDMVRVQVHGIRRAHRDEAVRPGRGSGAPAGGAARRMTAGRRTTDAAAGRGDVVARAVAEKATDLVLILGEFLAQQVPLLFSLLRNKKFPLLKKDF